MAHRINTVDSRSKLKPRAAPYWQKLLNGCHLGFRKMSATSEGSWIAQAYDPATRKQTRRSLGAFDSQPSYQRYDAAKKAAEAWFEHVGKGGAADTVTVKQACAQYVAHVRANKRTSTADDLEARFARRIGGDKIAHIDLPKLTRRHIDSWRQILIAAPVVINPHAEERKQVNRLRAASSVNRDMTALRAALNHALDGGCATSDAAWRVALRPIKNADGRRDAYLDREQRRALISKADTDVAVYLRGLSLVPLRPGALAALVAGNFDKRLAVLTIGKDKKGRDRQIKLPTATSEFFATLVKDKLPGAPMFARANGAPWDKDSWKKPIKAAVRAAELPDKITAYAFRHSAITDLVTGGLDLLTIAKLSGTSVAMIEKHYGHLQADHAAAALAGLAL
jgi:integrase